MGSHNRPQGYICTMKRKDLPIVQRQKGRDPEFCRKPVKKGIY